MNLATARFAVLLLLVALATPFVGPLVDHHFAERQPGHIHLSAAGYQAHTHGQRHSHVHTRPEAGDNGGPALALYDFEVTPPIPAVVAGRDMAMQSFLHFKPESLFVIPALSSTPARNHYPPPLDKPPELFL